jgi:hypothetical protein
MKFQREENMIEEVSMQAVTGLFAKSLARFSDQQFALELANWNKIRLNSKHTNITR